MSSLSPTEKLIRSIRKKLRKIEHYETLDPASLSLEVHLKVCLYSFLA